MLKKIRADTAAPKPPKIPIISKKSDWLEWWHDVHHYLTNDKLFVGLCGTSTHVSDGIEFDNKKQLAAPDDISIATIQSDALSMFRNTGDEYIGKGFMKLACLQDKYAGTSQI